ncbi:MAG: Coenzyme F420 hydrogenase/dehydrogenase, beta subunit C-terminal domain [Candidatus Hadarchaeaceae archaeon]
MVKIFNDLVKEVATPGYCITCGQCVASCPFECLAMEGGIPVLKKACVNCGICYGGCPQVIDSRQLEQKIFGRRASDAEVFGVYQQALSIEAKSPDIKARAQDGGAVTALLASLLEDGFIDGAIVMGVGNLPWQPAPRVATIRKELIECAGTKYAMGPLFLGLRDAVDLHYCSRVAIVGTPCQITASRRMQLSELTNRRLGGTIVLHLGLFCERAFDYEKFFRGVIQKQLRTPLSEVVKFDIKRGRFITYRRHKPRRELALEAIERYVCSPCKVCMDFAAELADISVGSDGSPLGRSTMLIRTRTGSEAFDIARRFRELEVLELEGVKPGIEAIRKTSKEKKLRAARELQRRKLQKRPLPIWMQEKPPVPKEEETLQRMARARKTLAK